MKKLLTPLALCLLSSTAYGATTHVHPSSNVQAAINFASAGDTIFFDPGTYNIKNITLKSGVTFHADVGTVTLRATNAAKIFGINGTASANITIDGFTFDGGYLDLQGASASAGQADNITVINNTFQNLNIDSILSAIFYTYLKNSRIDHNKFTNISLAGGTGSAINGHHADNTRITYNLFSGVHEAISGQWEGKANTGRNMYVGYNVGTGVERMGVEYLSSLGLPPGTMYNLIVENNWFSDWATTHNDGNRFAYSIVPNTGTGTIVRNNYANCGSGGVCDIAIELAGNGQIATGNDMRNFSDMTEVYQPGWSATNNNYVGGNCVGNACVHLYSSQGVTSSNTVVSGNTSNSGLAIPAPAAAGPQSTLVRPGT